MSYFDGPSKGYGWNAGIFLAPGSDEACIRQSMTIEPTHAQAVNRENGRVVVPTGAVIPSNDANAVGILFEDIDVTEGAKPGSVVIEGIVYEDLLPASVESTAKAVLTGITFATSPTITRPDYFDKAFAALTVESEAGTAAGDTAVTVTGYTPASGEALKYQVGDEAAAVAFGEKPSGTWLTYTAGTDITAASGKVITVVALSAGGYVIGAGSATVVAED